MTPDSPVPRRPRARSERRIGDRIPEFALSSGGGGGGGDGDGDGDGGPDLAEVAAGFGQVLHAAGVAVTPERTGRFAKAVVDGRPADTDELYWMARVTLAASRADIEVLDPVFAQVFRGFVDVADERGDSNEPPPPHTRPGPDRRESHDQPPTTGAPVPRGAGASADPDDDEQDDDQDDENETVLAAASTDEHLRTKDFAAWTPDELASLRRLIAELAVRAPTRPGRRHVRRDPGQRLDLRATLRHAHRTAGDPGVHVMRRRKERRRRIVLLADVSGSMESYSRAYLHLLHGAVRSTRAEAFVFATRLTRLTRVLQTTDPDEALRRTALAAPDWSGGTRIGEALRRFNDEHGRRGLARGAVVVIVSDGWEREDPALVGQQMERLGRLAHRVVWANPRAATAGYEPLAGGMAAALPHVDDFVSGHSPSALVDLLETIADA